MIIDNRLESRSPAGPKDRLEDPAAGRPPRILCADDEPAIRTNVATALVRAGYIVLTVGDGRTAWKLIQTEPFDLLITDLDMPEMSGGELIRKMRAAGCTQPVIVISATPEGCYTGHDRWLEISDVLSKPFSLRELVTVARRALTSSPPGQTGGKSAPTSRPGASVESFIATSNTG